jgi:hypothetical protein
MYISEYLQQEIKEKIEGDKSRFDELWQLVPNFSERLRSFNSDNGWVHWSKKTFDGWYCVKDKDGKFEVYYQERGGREPSEIFSDERDATRFLLKCLGYPR